jgi:hypothetical protein
MSEWPREIQAEFCSEVSVGVVGRLVSLTIGEGGECTVAFLSVDQCAAVIAAITDAARVVTGEKA